MYIIFEIAEKSVREYTVENFKSCDYVRIRAESLNRNTLILVKEIKTTYTKFICCYCVGKEITENLANDIIHDINVIQKYGLHIKINDLEIH